MSQLLYLLLLCMLCEWRRRHSPVTLTVVVIHSRTLHAVRVATSPVTQPLPLLVPVLALEMRFEWRRRL